MTTTPNYSGGNLSLSLSKIINPKKVNNKSLIKEIFKLFNKKYSKLPLSYDGNIIDNIIYNEKSHIVATFKDRLIIDDTEEFLKRYYKKNESDIRLPKFFEYYDLYSKIFPNYTVFYEGKYLYQNIQKKQRMIDLQEKMEFEEKQNKEKNEASSLFNESKKNVFNTDAMDSILNGTNNEEIEILFNINKNNIKQDEEIFNRELNNLIEEIDNYETKKRKIENSNKILKNKIVKNNNFKPNFADNNNNIQSNKNDSNNEKLWNKNISAPINLNYSKNKRIPNANSLSTINNTNITYYSNIKSIISKFFNIPSYQKNNILNVNSKLKNRSKMNNRSKYFNKKDKTLVERLEQNLFKMRQKSIFFQKNLSHNISTSNQTQKDFSISKKNSSLYTKKQSTSASSKHNPKTKKNLNNSIQYIQYIQNNNIIHNFEIKKNDTSPLTSRNPKTNKIGINLAKSKQIKNIKGNTYYISEVISRNRYSNNINFHNKAKSTMRGNVNNNEMNKIGEKKNSRPRSKKIINKTKSKTKNNEVKTKKERGYKEINYIKNVNLRNRNEIKNRMINNRFNNSSRNYNNRSRIKNSSLSNTVVNKKKNNPNISSYQLRIIDIMNIKTNGMKGFNINNFSKILHGTNINSKNFFSKTQRNNFSNIIK